MGQPTYYFSLHAVFRYLDLTKNDTATDAELRDKLIALLAIDAMARASDLERVFRESVTFSADGAAVMLELAAPKQTKEDAKRIPVRIGAYSANPNICSVATLRAFPARVPKDPIVTMEVGAE